MNLKLTEKAIAKITPSKERIQVLDDELRGFGVRVEPAAEGGRKSFYWRAKLNGRNVFRAIGDFPAVSVVNARTEAKRLAGIAADWKSRDYAPPNPFERKRRSQPTSAPVFRELVEAYIEGRVKADANKPGASEAAKILRAEKIARAETNVRWMVGKYFSDWNNRPLDEISIEDVLRVKNALGKKTYAANRCVEFVKAIFNWSAGKTEGKVNFWTCANPAKDVELHDEAAREIFLQPDELVRFNKALEDEPSADLRDFLILKINTGARRGNLYSMRWADIQWERKVWTVPYAKGGKSYNVQLIPAALYVLSRRRRSASEDAEFVFAGSGETGHVINLNRHWNAFRKRAGLEHIRLHDVRRTTGSYLAMGGISLQQIGAALGHRSLASTSIYARLHDEAQRAARETGAAKMLSMMAAAKKRLKAGAKPKLLSAARS